MQYLTNAFSLNMISDSGNAKIDKVSIETVRSMIAKNNTTNAIGHPDTDSVVRSMIDPDGTLNLRQGERMNVSLWNDDHLIVAQYKGPRLAEGATQLPEGATIEFYSVLWTE